MALKFAPGNDLGTLPWRARVVHVGGLKVPVGRGMGPWPWRLRCHFGSEEDTQRPEFETRDGLAAMADAALFSASQTPRAQVEVSGGIG